METDRYRNYLRDLGALLKEKASSAKEKENKSKGSEAHNYDLGFLMAMHEVISLMQQQAPLFGIDIDEIEMGGLDPERDLL